jgi:hypothetical protein
MTAGQLISEKCEIDMSHHLDCPVVCQDPRLDITDVYVLRGDRGTLLAMPEAGDCELPERRGPWEEQ